MKTNIKLRKLLDDRFGGLLRHGSHKPDEQACTNEFVSQYKGITWTDSPKLTLGIDLRSLNDAGWSSDEIRTQTMLPVIETLLDYPDWGTSRKILFAEHLAINVVQDIIGTLFDQLGYATQAKACKEATTLSAAKSAAKSAEYAAKYAAKYAEYAAKYAAESAKSAAEYAKSAAESAEYAAKYAEYAAKYAEYAKSAAESAAEYAAKYAAESAKYAAESAEYAAKYDRYLKMVCECFIRACMTSASDVE